MFGPWQVDITTATRQRAIHILRRLPSVPDLAADHLIGILHGEDDYYMHPADDRPVRVRGRGVLVDTRGWEGDMNPFTFLEEANIEYLV